MRSVLGLATACVLALGGACTEPLPPPEPRADAGPPVVGPARDASTADAPTPVDVQPIESGPPAVDAGEEDAREEVPADHADALPPLSPY